MANYVLLIILGFFIPGMSASGHSHVCRDCHNVRGPDECTHFDNCRQACVTHVRPKDGELMFKYYCGPESECSSSGGHDHSVCKECCTRTGCDQTTCSKYINKSAHAHTTPTTTITTATTTTARSTTMRTSTLITTIASTNVPTSSSSTTTKPAITSRGCDKLGVVSSFTLTGSVSYPGTPTCSDGINQPTEALVQKYCGAPNITSWVSGTKVMTNCASIPHYTAIAAVTNVFGGSTVAGVFVKCETGGFQAAIQTCGSQLKLCHVSTNSTVGIPSADKFVLLDWKH